MKNPYYESVKLKLTRQPKTWVVTGCAGFIGSHLIEQLLKLNQKVIGLDNFATGHRKNLNIVRKSVGEKAWKRFHFIRGDIRKLQDCYKAFGLKLQYPAPRTQNKKLKPVSRRSKVDIVLHQAALGSVPRSIKDPLSTHEVNVTGFVNMLIATRDAGVRRFVYASSSSVYGDSKDLPKREDRIGNQLSPYAVSKYSNELYAKVFNRCYELETIGLRYFNVFGPRQDPNGPYAAVIPRWIAAIKKGEPIQIYGDGMNSRDFCYVENAVQANILASVIENKKTINQVYNVACGKKITLKELAHKIANIFQNVYLKNREKEKKLEKNEKKPKIIYKKFRKGDIRTSLADLKKIKRLISFAPLVNIDNNRTIEKLINV